RPANRWCSSRAGGWRAAGSARAVAAHRVTGSALALVAFPFVPSQYRLRSGRARDRGARRDDRAVRCVAIAIGEVVELETDVVVGRLELIAGEEDDGDGNGRQQHHEKCILDQSLTLLGALSPHG